MTVLVSPFATEAPAFGVPVEIAPGILWLRLALPFRLNHVNVYLLEDADGWTLVDTGAGDAATWALWTALLDRGAVPLRGRPLQRIIATHHHPDHVGAAQALSLRTGAPVFMSETEYLTAALFISGDAGGLIEARRSFYTQNGLGTEQLPAVLEHLHRYRALVPGLPATVSTLRGGDVLTVGTRQFQVMEVPGHAAAQIVLHDADANILLVADQVLKHISPNISVSDRCPDDNPLGRYLDSLSDLRAAVPDGGLVLPGHHLPFRTLHARMAEIAVHHADRCAVIHAACTAGQGLTVADLVPILFPFQLDAHQFWFAFSEVLAHVNYMGRQGMLERRDSDGHRRWAASIAHSAPKDGGPKRKQGGKFS